jgi:uncharacterized protein YrzB (UPF0473 family)
MAWIYCDVDDLKVDSTSINKEIEGIILRDENGKERRFKVKGMLPQFTSYLRIVEPDIDWDDTNCHISILLGVEIYDK